MSPTFADICLTFQAVCGHRFQCVAAYETMDHVKRIKFF